MIYILNIGLSSYVFKSSRGLQTVIDTLSKARELKHPFYGNTSGDHLDLSDETIQINMHCVPGVSFVDRRDVIEPEVMPREDRRETKMLRGPRALKDGSRRAVATELRLMLGEGK